MSRVANNPVAIPSGLEVNLNGQDFAVKGKKGELQLTNIYTCCAHSGRERTGCRQN